jgi:DNA-directed RNA polymerase specialized sigma24 family protein
MSGMSLKPKTAFLLAFDRLTLELVVLRRYHSVNAALPALTRQNDEGRLAIVVEAENEAALRATHDLEEIALELRQSYDRGEADMRALKAAIAGLPYPERRVLELCSSPDGPRLTHAEAAAEIGCSAKTVKRVWDRGMRKAMPVAWPDGD